MSCSLFNFIQAGGPGGAPELEAVRTRAGLRGPRGEWLHGVVLSTQGAEGLQEEFSEGGGHRIVQDRGHCRADVEQCVGHHVEVVIEIVELAGRETAKPVRRPAACPPGPPLPVGSVSPSTGPAQEGLLPAIKKHNVNSRNVPSALAPLGCHAPPSIGVPVPGRQAQPPAD